MFHQPKIHVHLKKALDVRFTLCSTRLYFYHRIIIIIQNTFIPIVHSFLKRLKNNCARRLFFHF